MKKILTFLVIFIIVVVLAYQLGLTRLLTDLSQLQALIQESGWWDYLIFIARLIFTSVFYCQVNSQQSLVEFVGVGLLAAY